MHSAQAYGIISTCENELRAPRRTSINDSGKSAGLSSTIGGVADTFMAKGKAKSFDAKLAKATKVCGAIFFVATLVVCVLSARLG